MLCWFLHNLVLVLRSERGRLHFMQGCHTQGLGIGLRKLMVLTLSIHQIYQLRLNRFTHLYLYQPHSHMHVE